MRQQQVQQPLCRHRQAASVAPHHVQRAHQPGQRPHRQRRQPELDSASAGMTVMPRLAATRPRPQVSVR
ncbi:hypothetical protein RSSE_p1480 (plasmid) [Ralstonia solanacearum]|nr:hypothetical protein RSSE_p1480 [Ralstonia solanacearum]